MQSNKIQVFSNLKKKSKKSQILEQLGAKDSSNTLVSDIAPENYLAIVFDNSGSMYTTSPYPGESGTNFNMAQRGVTEFLRNCTKGKDSVKIVPMNPDTHINSTSTQDLVDLANRVMAMSGPFGLTPMNKSILTALHGKTTRVIVFTDGASTDGHCEKAIAEAIERKVPIDTIFFDAEDEYTAFLS